MREFTKISNPLAESHFTIIAYNIKKYATVSEPFFSYKDCLNKLDPLEGLHYKWFTSSVSDGNTLFTNFLDTTMSYRLSLSVEKLYT